MSEETDDKKSWMITDMDIELKNKVVAEAKLDEVTVAKKMEEILRVRYAKTKFVTSSQ